MLDPELVLDPSERLDADALARLRDLNHTAERCGIPDFESLTDPWGPYPCLRPPT